MPCVTVMARIRRICFCMMGCRFAHVSGITMKVRAGHAGLCTFIIPILHRDKSNPPV